MERSSSFRRTRVSMRHSSICGNPVFACCSEIRREVAMPRTRYIEVRLTENEASALLEVYGDGWEYMNQIIAEQHGEPCDIAAWKKVQKSAARAGRKISKALRVVPKTECIAQPDPVPVRAYPNAGPRG